MIKHEKNFAAGLMFVIVGAAFGLGAIDYDLGDAGHMGPGFFPTLLGLLLVALGLISITGSLRGRQNIEARVSRQSPRALIFVVAAVVSFGILLGGVPAIGLPPMGLAAAIFSAVILASYPGSEFKWSEVLVVAIVQCAFVYAVFVYALEMPFAMFPPFLQAN